MEILSVELRRVQQELAAAREELQTAQEGAKNEKRELFLRLNHELRTPLNEILGFAELLDMEPSNGRDNDNVQQILKAGRRLLDFISEALTEESEQEKPPEANVKKTVLYIEDTKANFTLVRRILQQRPGFHLVEAAKGELGLSIAAGSSPDVILLDLNLPDIHGSEVLRRLRERPETRAIPVVVISADANSNQIESLLKGGARNYLTKPFAVRKFLAVIDEIFEVKPA
jgi:CheY-like chemotaxis protein